MKLSNQEVLDILWHLDAGEQITEEQYTILNETSGLNFDGEHITKLPESIGQLTQLKVLWISNTKITEIPASIGKLSGLRMLSLSGIPITALPEAISQMTNLQVLYLNNTSITTLPSWLGRLSRLKRLSLSGSPITVLPESFKELSNLQWLALGGTQITVLPEYIGQLSQLKKLYLNNTQITMLPISIGQLSGLQLLDIGRTKITSLPACIGQLAELEFLWLSNTRISTLPDSVGQLSGLREMSLSNTQITELPKPIKYLSGLKRLFLSGTPISFVPEWLRKMNRLRELSLSYTQITVLPGWLGQMPRLQKIDLSGLTISEIPKSLALRRLPFVEDIDFWRRKTGINLLGVTLSGQDKSVFVETPELIPTLYQNKADMIPVRECRVIFLGDGEAGKSYTIKRFRAEGRKETPENPYSTSETPGVEILEYNASQNANRFSIHFWDFGGQQLLHSMHRCFLSEDCCYVVTVKTRETKADERARYWLRNVQAFAPKSPVLLYVNCWENDDGKRSLDEPGLCGDFPAIHRVVYCSAKRADDTEFRENVMEPILAMAAASPGIIRQVPRQWVGVRRSIEEEGKKNNYLTRGRYHELCEAHGVKNEQAPELLSYFNNLGVCFSFHRDREKNELSDYKLLNPVWLTNALYAIIEEGKVFASEGCIPRNAVQRILCNPAPTEMRRTVPEFVYKPEECPYILDVAIAHDLCYPVDNGTLFFPALCGRDTPEEARVKAKETVTNPVGFGQHVGYLLKYSYLPDSVLHQLMIRCMRNSLNVKSRWLRGMVLHIWNLHRIFIRMVDDESLKIDVFSTGEQPAYALFWFIRRQIEEINQKLNLQAKEFILDGTDSFPLGAVLAAAQRNIPLLGPDGDEHDAKKLLGDVFELMLARTLRVENGSIVIPIRKRNYTACPPNDANLRIALYITYKQICPYCGKPIMEIDDMQVDHILPASYNRQKHPELEPYARYLEKTGFEIAKPDYIENYFPTHASCNNHKRARVNEFSLPYWHDLASMRAMDVIMLKKRLDRAQDKLLSPEEILAIETMETN